MFTGIIRNIAKIESIKVRKNARELTLQLPFDIDFVEIGESISINGVCHSIANFEREERLVRVYHSPETLKITTLGTLIESQYVNIEFPLKLSDFLSGHLVQGHIDTQAKIVAINSELDSYQVRFQFDDLDFMKFLIYKGSIAIDGVSLTLNKILSPHFFEVMIISLTWEKTIFQYYQIGDKVNIEVDCIGKYLYQFSCQKKI